jgi:hypothetical protein
MYGGTFHSEGGKHHPLPKLPCSARYKVQVRTILVCNPSRYVGELEVKLHTLLASALEVLIGYKSCQRSNLCTDRSSLPFFFTNINVNI